MCSREDDYVDIPYISAASPHSLWGRHSCSRQSSSNIPRRSPVHLGRRSGKSGSSGYSWARPGYAATRSSYCSCCRTMTGAAEGRPGRACGRRTAAGSRVGVVRSLPCGFVLLYKGGGEMGWAVREEHPTASSACCVFRLGGVERVVGEVTKSARCGWPARLITTRFAAEARARQAAPSAARHPVAASRLGSLVK